MESDWKFGKLGDVADVVMGTSPPGDACSSVNIGLALLNGPTEFGPHHPVPVQFTREKKRTARTNDILFCVRGSTTGRMNWADQTYAIGRGLAAIRHKFSDQCQHFVRALIEHSLPSLLSKATGSTFPCVTKEDIQNIEICIPPEREQVSISRVLAALDDKIESNRQLNATLEQMARAMFKSWFIDFDPVRAVPALAPLAFVSAKLQKLFPSACTEIQGLFVPTGWTMKSIVELFDVNPQRQIQRGVAAPYLDMKSMPTDSAIPNDIAARNLGSGMRFKNGDTLIARITPCLENGKTAYVNFLADDQVGWGSTEYIVLRSKPPLPPCFSYFLARTEEFRSFLIANLTGSSGRQRVPASCLAQYSIAMPPNDLPNHFGIAVEPMLHQMLENSRQSNQLASLRDLLLPQLLSGRIRLRQADKLVEEALT